MSKEVPYSSPDAHSSPRFNFLVDARLRQILGSHSFTIYNDQRTISPYYYIRDASTSWGFADEKILTMLTQISNVERVNLPIFTITNIKTIKDPCVQLNWRIKHETKEQLGLALMGENGNTHNKLEKVSHWIETKNMKQKKEIPAFAITRKTSIYHPCYITDNVEQVMSYMSVIEIIKAQRVSKL